MKKFVIKTFLTIVIPVFLFLVAYEITMRRIPNDHSFKSKLWNDKVKDTQILVLGSSHFFYGIDPNYFDKPAFNASHVAQTYNYDWFIFDKYFDQMDSLQYVIIPLSVFSPYGQLGAGFEKVLCKEYAIHYGCRYHRWYEFKYRYHLAFLSPALFRRAIYSIIMKGFHDIHCDNNGYASTGFDDILDFAANGRLSAAREIKLYQTHDTVIYRENMELATGMIQRCQQKGIRVIFVTAPTTPEFYTLLINNQVKDLEAIGNNFATYDNVKYINLLKSPLFDRTDFSDATHLCDSGAKKLTLLLNDTINNWQ